MKARMIIVTIFTALCVILSASALAKDYYPIFGFKMDNIPDGDYICVFDEDDITDETIHARIYSFGYYAQKDILDMRIGDRIAISPIDELGEPIMMEIKEIYKPELRNGAYPDDKYFYLDGQNKGYVYLMPIEHDEEFDLREDTVYYRANWSESPMLYPMGKTCIQIADKVIIDPAYYDPNFSDDEFVLSGKEFSEWLTENLHQIDFYDWELLIEGGAVISFSQIIRP